MKRIFGFNFGVFWYSEKQYQMKQFMYSQRMFDYTPMKNFCRSIFSESTREYTEWVSSWPFRPTGKWGDYRLVGIGFYDHSEKF